MKNTLPYLTGIMVFNPLIENVVGHEHEQHPFEQTQNVGMLLHNLATD